jgi:hypothetical protein
VRGMTTFVVINLNDMIYRDGAITRAKLEKNEPMISYELFVEELDAGDSFTTSLIDILVKVSFLSAWLKVSPYSAS